MNFSKKSLAFIFIILSFFSNLCYAIEVKQDASNTIASTQLSQNHLNQEFFSNHDVQVFMQKMIEKHGFTFEELHKIFSTVNLRLDLLDKMRKPYEAKPWYEYKKHLLTSERVNDGATYWKQHHTTLLDAEKQYNIPTSIIVAILGVETMYGKIALKYPVLDTLTTLSFFYPERAHFFQSELENYLLLTKELNLEANEVYGSYAGAIGFPQFMPSSYRRFAVNFLAQKNNKNDSNHNQNVLGNLMNNHDDAIFSIANYLNHFGWNKNELVALKARAINKAKQDKLALALQNAGTKNTNLQITHDVKFYRKLGIKPIYSIPNDTHANLITLENVNNPEYWLSFNNFYDISRYNSSKHYVMAVYELAREICEKVQCKERF